MHLICLNLYDLYGQLAAWQYSPRRKAGFFIGHAVYTQMGESRALRITRMGDVGLSNTGDGVFTGREPQYQPILLWRIHLSKVVFTILMVTIWISRVL
jgi:hypothetical protein